MIRMIRTMNFLNSLCLARYGRTTFWSTTCFCCETKRIVPALTSTQITTSKLNPVNNMQRKVCSKNHALPARPTLWTQVRFCKSFPRFHRDLEYPNFDDYRKKAFIDVRKTSWGQGDDKVGFSYALGFSAALIGMYGAKSVCTYLVSSMSAAADVLALASVEIDLSKVAPGACDIIKWRGKPLFIKHRTEADIELEKNTPVASLRDPESPEDRAMKPEWLVVIGICTHLGCVPIANTGDHPGGFYCPCHGSHYDNLGRIRKGPAPTNLAIPPYKYVDDTHIIVG